MSNQRRNKWIGFIIAELAAIGFLLLIGSISLSFKPSDPTLALAMDVVTIAAAAAVAIIPIAYFAIIPVLPGRR
jgi:hypothetical protein